MDEKNSFKSIFIYFLKKVKTFVFMMIFILSFMKIFGTDNTLIGVCVYVGLAMFPFCDTGMKRHTMIFTILISYVGSTILSQINTISPMIALPINFIFVYIVALLTCEPYYLKMNIIMLLPFLFTQSVPVNIVGFKTRLISSVVGSIIIIGATLWQWKKSEFGLENSRSIIEQLSAGKKYKTIAIRLALGISFALLLSAIWGSKKPLWITIVVLSLTQFSTDEMISRMKHRLLGTVFGLIFFVITFEYLLPLKYGMVVVLLFGFLGSFFDDYRTKQFINTVSAINASLIIFNTDHAIINRVVGLTIGILIVLSLYYIEKIIVKFFRKVSDNPIT